MGGERRIPICGRQHLFTSSLSRTIRTTPLLCSYPQDVTTWSNSNVSSYDPLSLDTESSLLYGVFRLLSMPENQFPKRHYESSILNDAPIFTL